MRCRVCSSASVIMYGATRCSRSATENIGTCGNRFLYRCRDCGSITVDPTPTDAGLKNYYSNYAANADVLCDWKRRKSFKLLSEFCARSANGAILDIGCADGRLLSMLPPGFRKYGIDVAENACETARSKGVNVICSTLDSAEISERFDIIIALDFIEHTADPGAALKTISSLLTPGGHVIIETGNARSFTARTLKEDWFYTAVYGHLCVLSPEALVSLAGKHGIRQVMVEYGRHETPAVLPFVLRNVLAYGFHLFRLMYPAVNISGGEGLLKKLYLHSPPWTLNSDHMIFLGRKLNQTQDQPA